MRISLRKPGLCVCFALAMAFLCVLPAAACWTTPEPFEIMSGDGTKVFTFIPAEDAASGAQAAVYEIVANERRLVYTVEDLASFAYESNFFFSADMMHFARVFPPYGMSAFEVFSNGIRTKVVMRDDFIENYASVKAESSIGPLYAVTWRIGEAQDAVIQINTDEHDALRFDLAAAEFESSPVPRGRASLTVILSITGAAVMLSASAAFVLRKRKA
ncbi:MAG: hypothetical protein FWG72_10505 [Oscillospiraceae bacterium]|nr:hypothetical protein [Oscillospiraceae bacterium]